MEADRLNLIQNNLQDLAADYVYLGDKELDFEIPGTLGAVFNAGLWEKKYKNQAHCYPVFNKDNIDQAAVSDLNFYFLEIDLGNDDCLNLIEKNKHAVLVVTINYDNRTQVLRRFRCELDKRGIQNPVIIRLSYETEDLERFQLNASSDFGIHLIDGFGDGVWINGKHSLVDINSLSFGILQATRTRISKTEYISCPSCGRTLFDLQETTAKIRQKTSHLKGIKIGIMGCIVNGPGEMADADYGYVGTGPGKINLYKEKTVVRKNVNENEAVDALIELIRENGDWVEVNQE